MSEKNDSKFFNGRQICKIQTAKKCIAFYDELRAAPLESYAALHANGEDFGKGNREYSRIKVQLLDYSGGTGDKTKKAEFNLTPDQVIYLKQAVERELDHWQLFNQFGPMVANVTQKTNRLIAMVNYIKQCFKSEEAYKEALTEVNLIEAFSNLEYRQDKIVAAKVDANGRSPMTRFSLTHTPFAPDGKPMKSPWRISIDKGTAIAEHNAAGGSYAKGGSFVSDNKGALTFNASDEDIMTSLISVERTIDVFEKVVCGAEYKQGKAFERERRRAEQNQ